MGCRLRSELNIFVGHCATGLPTVCKGQTWSSMYGLLQVKHLQIFQSNFCNVDQSILTAFNHWNRLQEADLLNSSELAPIQVWSTSTCSSKECWSIHDFVQETSNEYMLYLHLHQINKEIIIREKVPPWWNQNFGARRWSRRTKGKIKKLLEHGRTRLWSPLQKWIERQKGFGKVEGIA